jgi:hypothetical protein
VKISKDKLSKIIREELQSEQELSEFLGLGDKARAAGQAGLDKMRSFRDKFRKPQQPAAGQTDTPPPAAQTDAAPPSAATPPASAEAPPQAEKPADAPAAAVQPQQDPASNPKLLKRLEVFKQNIPQYFSSLDAKLAGVIQGLVSKNVKALEEEAPLPSQQGAMDPEAAKKAAASVQTKQNSPEQAAAQQAKSAPIIAKVISKQISQQLSNTLKQITPQEFAQAYQIVAKKNIKDPKQLAQTLKTFRGLEEQQAPLLPTELDLLDAVLQAKKIGLAGIVQKAAKEALSSPQLARFVPPEQVAMIVKGITDSAKSMKQLLANQSAAGAKPASTQSAAPAPAAPETPAAPAPAAPETPAAKTAAAPAAPTLNRQQRRAANSKRGGPSGGQIAGRNPNKREEQVELEEKVKLEEQKSLERWQKLAGLIKG